MKALTYVEIDLDYCSLTYGVGACTASIPATGPRKCMNTLKTCQVRTKFVNAPITLRFAQPADYLPRDIEAIPSINGVSFTPGTVSLGEDLGQRATLSVSFGDHRWSDAAPGFDKYLAERGYDAFARGTFWGKFRARHPYLRGRAIRLIRGVVGQALADMETRHYILESFTGPTPDGVYTLTAKDVLKLADGDRAQAPKLSNGFLVAAISETDTQATLSPTGVGNAEYPVSGYIAIGGKEICGYTRDASVGNDANTLLLLHCDGVDASTSFPDASPSLRTATANGNVQVDIAQAKFGNASALFDGTGDYISLPDSNDWTFPGDFTIECWARISTLAAARTLVCHSTDINNMYRLFVTTAGALSFVVTSASSAIITVTSANALIAIDTWYHLAVTRSGTTYRLFINGAVVATVTDADAIPNFTSTLKIGISGNGSSDAMLGWIDEVRISKVARWTATFTPPAGAYAASADIVTLTRAQYGTDAAKHDAQDRAQLVLRYVAQDPANIIADLLHTYAEVPSEFIPIDTWLTETQAYNRRLYTGIIAEPTSVNALCSELIEQAALAVWWSDVLQQIRLQVLRQISTDAQLFDAGTILQGTLSVQEQPSKRISQVWTYFGQRNPLQGVEEPDNYRSTALTVDLQAQTDYGAPAIKKIYSRWIPAFGRTVATRLNNIQLGRFRDPPRKLGFSLFRVPGDFTVRQGGGYRVGSQAFQDETGALVTVPIQVTRLNPDVDKFSVEAEEMLFINFDDEDLTNRQIIIDGNAFNLNLRTIHDTLFPAPVAGDVVTCIIESGVIVGSNNVAFPAFDVGSWPAGVSLTLRILGRIQGAGGAGGPVDDLYVGEILSGGDGGTALRARSAISLDVAAGEIWGGGGGGAHGGRGGGGGGAGQMPGKRGLGYNGGASGSPGTTEAGGAGGAGSPSQPTFFGGAGGGPGLPGAETTQATAQFMYAGVAGAAIDGLSYITIAAGPGDRRGPEIN